MSADDVKVLLYHAVREDGDFPTDAGTNVPPASFEAQLAFLAGRYDVVSLEEALSGKSRGAGRAVAVTFDDGYEDTFTLAYPLLKKYGLSATFFLTVSQVGKPWRFPRGPYPGIQWEQVQEMAKDPLVGFGSHGLRHLDLTGLSREEAADEIVKSKEILEGKLSRSVRLFSYPHGSFNDEVRTLVRGAGYDAAFSVVPARPGRYSQRRILISRRDTLLRFRLKLSPLYWPARRCVGKRGPRR